MKTNIVLITALLSLFMVLSSCNNDDDNLTVTPETKEDPKEEPVNKAPGSFDLVAIANNEITVGFSPTFSWNEAVDPDGDMVTYDFYLANEGESLDLTTTDLTTTSIDQELSFSNAYQWKVLAKDSLGASSESETFFFSTRNLRPLKRLADQTTFSERRWHSLVSFQDRLWMFGGESGNPSLPNKEKDLWHSNNGIDWVLATDTAPFGHRSINTPIVYNEKLFIIGGSSSKPGSGIFELPDFKNDVWATNNGVDWTQIEFNASFTERAGHSLVVFQDKIWLFGGLDELGEYQNDLHVSEDGAIWDRITLGVLDISDRAYAKMVVFNDKLYLIGGSNKTEDFKEVWESENGTDWKLVAQGNEVPANRFFNVFTYRDKLILVDQFIDNKIWYSDDAITWKSVEENIQYTKRQASSSLPHNDKIYIIGGMETKSNGSFGDMLNDVWVVE